MPQVWRKGWKENRKYVYTNHRQHPQGREGFALEYGKRGQNLIITARSGDKLQELKREIEKDNQVSIECIIMDLAAEGSAKLLYEEIRKRKLHVRGTYK